MSQLPKPQALIVADGRPTRAMYDWMRSVDVTFTPEPVQPAPPPPSVTVSVRTRWSVSNVGTPSEPLLQLTGDVQLPNVWHFYGRGAGNRAFVALSDGFTNGAAITKTVTDGVTQFELSDLADSGIGAALVKITRDAKGRVEGTEAASTTDLSEGANLYFTDARALTAFNALRPYGHIYFDATTDQITNISATDTPVVASVTTALGSPVNGFDEPQNNRLRYTGASTFVMKAQASFTISNATTGETFTAYIAKNGTILADSKCRVVTNTAGNGRSGVCVCFVQLEQNDYLEFWLENNSSTGSIRVDEFSLVCNL